MAKAMSDVLVCPWSTVVEHLARNHKIKGELATDIVRKKVPKFLAGVLAVPL
jgi:hypothetical protein